jgi:hypothetical protein
MCNRLIHSVQSLRQSTKAFPDNRPMGFRFRRSFSILPGIRLNLGKRGISASIGVRGAHVTFGPTGTRTTVGLPGSGLSYTHLQRPRRPVPAHAAARANPAAQVESGPPSSGPASSGLAWSVVIAIAVAIAIMRWSASAPPASTQSAPSPSPPSAAAERPRDDKTAAIDAAARGAAQLRRNLANAHSLTLARVTLMPDGAVCYELSLKNSRGVPYRRTAVMNGQAPNGQVPRLSGTSDFDSLWNRRCGKTQAGRDITAEMSRRLRSTTP